MYRLLKPASIIVVAAVATIALGAQSKLPPTVADYGQFETLALQPRGGLSPDGKWLAYGINRSSRENELRIAKIADGSVLKTVPFGMQATFSADSRWVAYAIGYSEAQEERLRKDKKPIHRKLGILNLASGESATIDGIESFAFNASGTHLAMRRYVPERTPPAPPPSPDDPPAGATLIVRELETRRDHTFGSVSEFSWQEKGPLLAFAISADEKIGNGVHVLNPGTSSLRVLDSAAAIYTGVTWRKESADLVVLRSSDDSKREGSTHLALAWTGVTDPEPLRHSYDPRADTNFPTAMRIVSYRRPSWADDGQTIFVGIAAWADKTPPPQERKSTTAPEATEPGKISAAVLPEAARETANAARMLQPQQAARETTTAARLPLQPQQAAREDEEIAPSTVDVWHARDVDVMPRQKLNARADRQRNLVAAWHIGSNTLVQLGKDKFEQVTPIRRQTLALAHAWNGYAMDRTIGRPAADLSLVDVNTGDRTKLVDRVNDAYVQSSPGGRYILYFHADHYWTINTATRLSVNITKAVPASFVNRESDLTIKQKPPFGVAGWTQEDRAVVLYDKFDLWKVNADGSGAVRLTSGAADQIRHRYVRLDPDEEWIDLDKPMTVSLFGIWTKQSGYGRVAPGASQTERLVWLDKSIGNLAKAKDADVYAYVVQSFEDSPDLFVGSADLKTVVQVTSTNPFQSNYAWGRSEVIEYTSARGERLQGALHYPAGYQPGRRYPMVVYLYERLSDGVHRFVAPSERDYYNAAVFTSLGYVFFQPDIVFRAREPGLSVVECVEPAVKKVLSMGIADPARVGVVGHSWGGFDAAFLATNSTMFAAAVAGAPIVNLVSNYGNHHWSSGIAETDHIETGQQRMEVPLWEDLPAYIRNSAVFNVHTMKTPLLIEVGDADGTVFWHQGVELYNIARRAKKDVVLLNYGGEDHGLRKKANQIDYHNRIVQWFGHYLKNEPAAGWITQGTSFIDRENELKRVNPRGRSDGGS